MDEKAGKPTAIERPGSDSGDDIRKE